MSPLARDEVREVGNVPRHIAREGPDNVIGGYIGGHVGAYFVSKQLGDPSPFSLVARSIATTLNRQVTKRNIHLCVCVMNIVRALTYFTPAPWLRFPPQTPFHRVIAHQALRAWIALVPLQLATLNFVFFPRFIELVLWRVIAEDEFYNQRDTMSKVMPQAKLHFFLALLSTPLWLALCLLTIFSKMGIIAIFLLIPLTLVCVFTSYRVWLLGLVFLLPGFMGYRILIQVVVVLLFVLWACGLFRPYTALSGVVLCVHVVQGCLIVWLF